MIRLENFVAKRGIFGNMIKDKANMTPEHIETRTKTFDTIADSKETVKGIRKDYAM